jgi:isopentenyl-diphosphate delta-isomerase
LVIASGGLRSGLDGARAVALGADLFSMSKPMLQGALRGLEEARRAVGDVIRAFRIAMFLTGSRNLEDLKKAPIVLGPRLMSWLNQRGVSCRGANA